MMFQPKNWIGAAAAACLVMGLAERAGAEGVTLASGACYAPGTPLAGDFKLGGTIPGYWGDPTTGDPVTVTWSLTPSGTPTNESGAGGELIALDEFMPTGFKAEIERAFAAWAAVANITFVEVVDNGLAFNADGATGDIRISGHLFDGPGGTLAHGYYPPVNGVSAAGDIHFDTKETWKIGFGGSGFDVFQVAAHEIGHALGLDHSNISGALMYPYYSEAFVGPQADDIAGIQSIYGAPRAPAVPEPSSVVLAAVGLALSLGAAARRRRAAAAA